MTVSSPKTKKQGAARRQAFPSLTGVDKLLLTLISCLGLILAGLAGLDSGLTGLTLVVLGMLLGMTFIGFQYGFASGWRQFLEKGDASALSLHFLLAALCALIFIPISEAGLGPSGSVAPVSLSLLIGAFMFGIGMQLANGCRIRRAVQLWWRVRSHDCCLAIFCFWIRAGVDHSATSNGLGVTWSGRDWWEPDQHR